MKSQGNADLIKILSRLNEIAADLPEKWDTLERNKIRSLISNLENEISKHGKVTGSTPSKAIFADRKVFPSRGSIVAYLDAEIHMHVSPDWVRQRLEAEAARLASDKTQEEIMTTAAKLAGQNWSVRPRTDYAWQTIFGKSEEQIKAELGDTRRFPTVEALKRFASGLLTYDQMKSISKRETLITKIAAEITRHSGVSKLGER